MEKEEIKFECRFNKEVKPEDISWYKDGIKLADKEEDGRISITSDGDKQYLTIKNANLEDGATYEVRCKGVKSAAIAKVKGKCNVDLYISIFYKLVNYIKFNDNKLTEEPVVFVKKLEEVYNPVEKQSVELECEVNKDNVKCIWKKYGKKIESDDEKIFIESIGRLQRLTIKNLSLQDKQNITCAAIKGKNEDDELATTSARIIVQGNVFFLNLNKFLYRQFNFEFFFYYIEGPLEIVNGLEDTHGKEDHDVILSVELNKPNQEVEWFKDGVKLASEPNKRIYSNNNIYYLRMNDAKPKSNDGVYTFKVKDFETSGRLLIEGINLNSTIYF